MEGNSSFNYNDLLGYVRKPYLIDGKQYIFPLKPTTRTQFGLGSYFSGPLTADETFDAIKALSDETYWTNSSIAFSNYTLQSTFEDFVDRSGGTCSFDSKAFVSILQELLDMDTDTCIISTPYDAYRAVHLICHALPIERICKSHDLVCFHLDDYIDDVRNAVLESRFRAYPILDEHEHVVGTLSRFHLLRPRRKQVILVDHNEKAQSVAGLDQADILEIVDHHRLADIETTNPIYVRNEPVGSSATIVADMYQEKGLMPTAKMAGLMASAIVSDTVMFKSPTCTQRDIDIANRMARIANVSLEDLGKTVFSASVSDDKSAEMIIGTDYKEFHIAGHNLAVSQVTCMDAERLTERTEEFLDCMRGIRHDYGLDTVLLMITDVLKEGSYLLYVGDEDTIRQAFNISGEKNPVFLPEVMSRKKQIIPVLSALWG